MLSTFKRIWKFSKNRHKNLILALLCSFFRSAFSITQILAIMLAIEGVRGEIPIQNAMWKIVLLALVCILGNFLTSYVEQMHTLSVGFYMVADKRIHIANVLKNMPLGMFSDKSVGKMVASLTTTLSGVETASTMVMIGIVSGLFNAFCLFLFMLIYEYKIGMLMGIGMLLYLLTVCYQMRASRKNAPALQNAQTELADAALTYLQGIQVTKAFRFQDGEKSLKNAIQNSATENIALTNKSMPSQFLAHFVIAIFESLLLLCSLYTQYTTQAFDIVKVIVLLIFSFMAFAALNQAGSMLSMIGLLDSGMQEIESMEQEQQLTIKQPIEEPKSNEIVFHDVSFSYGNHEVLHHIDTVIPEHAVTAIIGPSGSGKTTLCQLIPRFRDVNSGSITIGGADVRHIDSKCLMSKISMVFQKVYLFEDTVFNNIRFGRPDATREEVMAVAKKARCHDFIMALPNGYDTVILEGGSSLSGGEKQRISIARAMLKDAPIIILDEATSALDAENEHDILSAIEELTQDKTVITIAHRIKTVENAQHILVLEQGKIVQEGTHRELKDCKGIYQSFLSAREKASQWKL